MELQDDWSGLADELQRLIRDARDVLDATKFLSGSGTNEPAGVLTGLTTTQRVQTATTASVAIADIYSLKQAVPARFQSGSVSMWHPNRLDTIYRFVGGNSTEPPLMLKYPLDSPEFEDAARCAGPTEIAFTREILKQELDKLAGRHAVIDHRRDELRALYPGIKKAD